MNAPKSQPSILQRAGRHALQAGLALAALTGGAKDAKAETHKGVFMVVGINGSQIAGRALDVNYDTEKPETSTATSKNAVNQAVKNAQLWSFAYNHNVIENNLLIHQNDSIHVFWNIANGVTKKTPTLKLDASNVEKWDPKDNFLISEGDTIENTQLIVPSNSGIIKTYNLIKDDAGKITGLKLVAETDLSSNDIFQGCVKRVYKDIMVATNDYENTAILLNKDAQGNWKIILQKVYSEGLSGFGISSRNPIFPAPNGDIRAKFSLGFDIALANKELQIIEKSDTKFGLMNFGTNNEYQIYYEETGTAFIKNSKGEAISIKDQNGKDVNIDTDAKLVQISSSPNTFVGIGVKETATILKIISDSPLKVEAYTLPQEATKDIAFDKGHAIIVGSDPDKDLTYHGDNCETVPNKSQTDSDYDGRGDQCDPTPLKVGEFSQSEMLPGSGFMFLCNPGKVTKSVDSSDGDNISFVNMAKGESSSVQFIGQQGSQNNKLAVTLEAGFQIDPSIIDGNVYANGKPLTETLVTSETTKITFGAHTNVKFTFTNLGTINPPPVDTSPVEEDAGSQPDTETDAGSSPETTEGTDIQSGKDTEEQKPDTANKPDTNTQYDAGNDTGKADAGSSGSDSYNGAEISQQPPTGPSPAEGCTASPNSSGGPLRDSAPLVLALGAVGLARLQEMRKKYDDMLREAKIKE